MIIKTVFFSSLFLLSFNIYATETELGAPSTLFLNRTVVVDTEKETVINLNFRPLAENENTNIVMPPRLSDILRLSESDDIYDTESIYDKQTLALSGLARFFVERNSRRATIWTDIPVGGALLLLRTLNHEGGHLDMAQQLGYNAEMFLNFFQEHDDQTLTPAYVYIYDSIDDSDDMVRLTLAGMHRNYEISDAIDDSQREQDFLSRRTAFAWLITHSDFHLYALRHYISTSNGSEGATFSDLRYYIEATDTDPNVLYTMAVADVLLNFREWRYYTLGLFGKQTPYPEPTNILGFEAETGVYPNPEHGIEMRIRLKKTF